jgi:serine phosphatase RsbU (regulator of sigma subunit)
MIKTIKYIVVLSLTLILCQNIFGQKGGFNYGYNLIQNFTNIKQDIQLCKGDVLYMFSDGFADKLGGPSAKKLKYNQFKKFILESMFLTMEEQKIYLEQMLNEWQGDLEQVDDVLVIGVRIV